MDTMIRNNISSMSDSLEKEHLSMAQKPTGVKCDIVNECQMFLKAEDGGGDTHLNLTEISSMKEGDLENIMSHTNKSQVESHEKQTQDSNEEETSEGNGETFFYVE